MDKNSLNIPSLEELKKLKPKDLKNLAKKIRKIIFELSNEKAIHFSSNLGIVELSIALLYCFDSPKDQIIYDTGHQSYVHKILTNRSNKIFSIRDYGGLSGFQEPNESEHDFISNGHSGNALSITQGINEHKKNNNFYIPVIGDASLSNGLSFEALNSIAFNDTKMIIIINDNDMSISKNVGMLHKKMSKLRTSKINFISGNFFRNIFGKSMLMKKVYLFFSKITYFFENFFYSNNFFQSMGYKYIGPVNGHDIDKLIYALKKAKWYSDIKPTIVHVKTKKGYGHDEALNDIDGQFHSPSISKTKSLNFGEIAAKHLETIMNKNKDVVILNPAMTLSTGFLDISKKFKNNYEDIGIAEEHGVSKAVGISKTNKKVFIVIYSTFLQRCYDQILHDVARNKLPITFLIDRADIAYSDGDTHHGIYDVSFLKTIPNTIITSPSNKYELEKLIDISMQKNSLPFFIRYPKSDCPIVKVNYDINFGEWIWIQKKHNAKSLIISYGPLINEIKNRFNDKNIDIINAIFITYYDVKKILTILKKYEKVFVVEKVYFQNNLYMDLIKHLHENDIKIIIKSISIKKSEIGFGSQSIIDKTLNIDIDSIEKEINS